MLTALFCGADQTVTGSMHHFEYIQKEGDIPFRFCVDAGFFQVGEHVREWHLNKQLFFKPSELDAVVLTHAHLDHVGRLPYLVAKGFNGPVFATEITAKIAAVVMADAAKQQFNAFVAAERGQMQMTREEEAFMKGMDAHEWVLYSNSDVEKTNGLFRDVAYHQTVDIHPNLAVTFYDAGHILGSAWITIVEKSTGKTLVCSGDLGSVDKPFIRDPEMPHNLTHIEAVFIETTYGNKLHATTNGRPELARLISQTAERGGTTLIPAFAVQRSQEIIFMILEAMEQGAVPRMPVYLDSPMADAVTTVFASHFKQFDNEAQGFQSQIHKQIFSHPLLHIIHTREQSIELNHLDTPSVIIAGSGMMNGGRILKHLAFHGGERKNSLLLVGYQAEGTIGRHLAEGASSVPIDGKMVHIQLQVHQMEGFSGHGDQDMLQKWLFSALPPAVFREKIDTTVFLVHGEPEGQAGFAAYIHDKVGKNVGVVTPAMGQTTVIWQ
jgi:metallo-beta-lactamase family protein